MEGFWPCFANIQLHTRFPAFAAVLLWPAAGNMDKCSYQLVPAQSQLRVLTYKAGPLSAMGHNLCLSVFNYSCTVEQRTLTVTVDAKGIAVEGQLDAETAEGPSFSPLGGWAVSEITKNMQSVHILNAEKFPEIKYTGELQPRYAAGLRLGEGS